MTKIDAHLLKNLLSRTVSYKHLICVDFEATCDEVEDGDPSRALIVLPAEMEIIEVGIAVLDLQSLELVDRFQQYVRPVLNPTLTPFCTKLTSITQVDVDAADHFPLVSERLTLFLSNYPSALWTSWGRYDAEQLRADVERARCTSKLSTLEHIDLEKAYREIYQIPSLGLKPATQALGIAWTGRYHRGIDDAVNVARIAARLLGHAKSLK